MGTTVLQFDLGVLAAIGAAVIGAWWGVAVLAIRQFERRMAERFDELEDRIGDQKKEHATALAEIRRVENELVECRVEASRVYMTKADATNQHRQVIDEIRALGSRIDSMHRKETT